MTSRSIRKDTSSLAPGSDGAFGADSAGLVVAALKAISAVCRESVGCLAIADVLARPGAICPAGMAPGRPSRPTKRESLHLRRAPPMDAEMIALLVGRRGQR